MEHHVGGSAGLHIIMDAYVKDSAVFTQSRIEELFEKLVAALDMKMLAAPQIYKVPVDPEVLERVKATGKFEDEGGITGVAVISTSHISIHCWPLQRFFSLDVFSCKNFDSAKAIGVIEELFDMKSKNVRIIPREKPGNS